MGNGVRDYILGLFVCLLIDFLGLQVQDMDVARVRVELELQLLVYTTATPDPSCLCDLHQNLWQHQILNPHGCQLGSFLLSLGGNSQSGFSNSFFFFFLAAWLVIISLVLQGSELGCVCVHF